MKAFVRILLCIALVFATFIVPASAAPSADAGAYTITDYSVNVKVQEDKTYDITETISVFFTQPRHGLERDIPFKGTIYRRVDAGPSQSKYRLSINNIDVLDNQFTVHKSGDFVSILIGDPNVYVEGAQTYQLSYKLVMGRDNIKEFDEAYLNIIGIDWNTSIEKADFTIEMPKPFDPQKLAIFTGGADSAFNDNAVYNVDGNVISGQLTKPLGNYEGITMRLELPEGYFTGGLDPRLMDWALAFIIAVLAIIGVLLFVRYGRDQKPVVTVEFYPPDGMNSAELGYVYDGRADSRDAISLIMYWAHKGYLTIEQLEKEFILNKLKDMGEEAKPMERHMFNALFKNRETVTTTELKYSFYQTIDSTVSMLGDSFSTAQNRVFTKSSMAFKPLLSCMAALPLMMAVALYIYRDTYDLGSTLIATVITATVALLPVFGLIYTMRYWRSDNKTHRVMKLMSFLLLSFITMTAFVVITAGTLDPVLLAAVVLGTAVLALTAVFISKRTPKGVEWLGKALGLRDFIERAERDKLLALVQQDPSYFYYVLPYAYVLNITDKWAKNFEGIALQPPDWYQGAYGHTFTPLIFVSAMNHSMTALQTNMTAKPQSRGGSGGFGGGGGFSGGGAGGGGGGSW